MPLLRDALCLFAAAVVAIPVVSALQFFCKSINLRWLQPASTSKHEFQILDFARRVLHLTLLMIIVFLCDGHKDKSFITHSSKFEDLDFLLFLALLFLLAALPSLKAHGDGSARHVLNRDQTEEWKGWMQFLFVGYHYFNAGQVYNEIRVFVSAYIWMTGMGNFSYFYLKNDFSVTRMLRMIWRMNFFAAVACVVLDRAYIIYYIVPLHTMFFLMVYVAMYIKSSINRTQWLVRIKLLVVGVVVWILWDVNGLFDLIFSFLSPTFLHELHFRSYLDHFSCLWGMIFALNLPVFHSWLNKVESLSPTKQHLVKFATAGVVFCIFVAWAYPCLPLGKVEFNSVNPYLVFIPITSYVFFRNLFPIFRRYNLMLFAEFGKITLETYILQHHLLLGSDENHQPKRVLVVLDGFPKLNLLLCAVVLVVVAKQAFTLTVQLRDDVIPDAADSRLLLRRLVYIIACGLMSVGCAFTLSHLELSLLSAALFVSAISVGVVFFVSLRASSADDLDDGDIQETALDDIEERTGLVESKPADDNKLVADDVPPRTSKGVLHSSLFNTAPPFKLLAVASLTCVALLALSRHSASVATVSSTVTLSTLPLKSISPSPDPFIITCGADLSSSNVLDACKASISDEASARSAVAKQWWLFVGDSTVRYVFQQLFKMVNETNFECPLTDCKHANIDVVHPSTQFRASFVWAPLVENFSESLTSAFRSLPFTFKDVTYDKIQNVVFGFGLWDALLQTPYDRFAKAVHDLSLRFPIMSHGGSIRPMVTWLGSPHVVEEKLQSEEKKHSLTNQRVMTYSGIASAQLSSQFVFIYSTYPATLLAMSDTEDGIHYPQVSARAALDLVRLSKLRSAVTSVPTKKVDFIGADLLEGLFTLIAAGFVLLIADNFLVSRVFLRRLGGTPLVLDECYNQ